MKIFNIIIVAVLSLSFSCAGPIYGKILWLKILSFYNFYKISIKKKKSLKN